jgi:hypothetical protein
MDSFYVGILGCPDLVLDSISMDRSELHALNVFPDTLRSTDFRPLRLLFAPDSSGEHEYAVTLHGHSNRRVFDTTILVHATSVRAPEYFVLSDTSHQFVTSYCEQQNFALLLGSTSCDSIHIDSIVSSAASFFTSDTAYVFPGNGTKSIQIYYSPSSIGADSGSIRIVGHSRFRTIDTTIAVRGINNGNADPFQLSDTSLHFATSACKAMSASLSLTNQCCEALQIDTIFADAGEFLVDFDRSQSLLASNDTLPISLQFSPDSGGSRVARLHIRGHVAGRAIDTVITLAATNTLATRPLELASDTLYLLTKYCHAVEDSINLRNLGCPDLVVDSVVVLDDERHEFSVTAITSSLGALGEGSVRIRFDPDTSGQRRAHIHLFGHLGDQFIDTLLTVFGRNVTAPEPYLVAADSQYAGKQLRTAIYFRPTTDTFAIKGFSAHLAFNTDILTPTALAFDGTCSGAVQTATITRDATGARIDVVYVDSMRQTADLQLPVAWMVSNVALTKDLTTAIELEGFSTDVEPELTLCSVPSSVFTTLLDCGDPLVVQFLKTGRLAIDAIQPNPVSAGHEWNVSLRCDREVKDVSLELYTMTGSRIARVHLGDVSTDRPATLASPPASGDYFLVVRSSRGIEDARRVTTLN